MTPRQQLVFVTGLHRSGTTPLYRIISKHPDVSGFRDTGAPEDEGQHLQTVIPPGSAYGGPGKFAFDARSYLDDRSSLATEQVAQKIWDSWSPHWDLEKSVLVEKSPTSIVRTRFFQALFPNSKFVVIVRHPLIVGSATQKMNRTQITLQILHWCLAHDRLMRDAPFLGKNLLLMRYEDLAAQPDGSKAKIFDFIGLRQDVALGDFVDHNLKYDPRTAKKSNLPHLDWAKIPFGTLNERFGFLFKHFKYDLAKPFGDQQVPPSKKLAGAAE